MASFNLTVNGRHGVANVADPAMPLLYFLRNELGRRGPRFGCGLVQCGACSVILGGVAVRSCVYTMSAVKGPVRRSSLRSGVRLSAVRSSRSSKG